MTKRLLKKILIYGFAIVFITAALVITVLRLHFEALSKAERVKLVVGLIIVLVISAVFSIYISCRIVKTVVKPIEEIGNNLEKIEEYKVYSEFQPFVNALSEQKKKQKELNKQKKQFTANISHELKTPLTSIAGYAELIETGFAKEEDIKPFASIIRKQALRLVTLSEDIIQLSQLEENDEDNNISFQSVDIYEIAARCAESLSINARLKGIQIDISGESSFVRGNTSLLEELIYNLCDNAIRYNNENGKVSIDVTNNNEFTVLSVADTGIGIDAKYQEHIFERFFRVDKSRSKETGGTGLGLAIVKHIAQLHDAQLKIDSELGEGTVISVYFKK
ncbi:MAG: ATP-binding protein [Clostridium sp.]|nr:ATP-binding protein [Clostridium sp.]